MNHPSLMPTRLQRTSSHFGQKHEDMGTAEGAEALLQFDPVEAPAVVVDDVLRRIGVGRAQCGLRPVEDQGGVEVGLVEGVEVNVMRQMPERRDRLLRPVASFEVQSPAGPAFASLHAEPVVWIDHVVVVRQKRVLQRLDLQRAEGHSRLQEDRDIAALVDAGGGAAEQAGWCNLLIPGGPAVLRGTEFGEPDAVLLFGKTLRLSVITIPTSISPSDSEALGIS